MKCERCGTEFEQTPGMTNCPKCGTDIPGSGRLVCSYTINEEDSKKQVNAQGPVIVAGDYINFHKKSIGVRVMFGAIGSAIEGDGKLLHSYSKAEVLEINKVLNPKGKLQYYDVVTSGAKIRLSPAERKTEAFEKAMDSFLAE
jgi:hypothetical protein